MNKKRLKQVAEGRLTVKSKNYTLGAEYYERIAIDKQYCIIWLGFTSFLLGEQVCIRQIG